MSLSVIVTSYRSADLLHRCLTALSQQPEAEDVVVADCSPEDPSDDLRARFPRVKVLHFREKRTVPQLRWAAVAHTTGDLIAAIEARCVPTAGWCAHLVQAHERNTETPAAGGPVLMRTGGSAFDWGVYLSEFGLFAPPLQEGAASQLSGANLSYKRAALEGCRDLLDAGAWEASLHERWLRAGQRLCLCPATIEFHNGMRVADAFRMRFHYARSYAAGRFGATDRARRLIYTAGGPLLPFLLTWRGYGASRRAGTTPTFRRSLPWVLALNAAWAAGEVAGYVAGCSSAAHIY